MATPKFVGVETEYGIAVDGPVDVNPVLASSMVVGTYRRSGESDVGWDHTDEQPLRDARGFDVHDTREHADVDVGLASTVLTNGARFYVDHAHPEYATPECSNALDLVVWDKAGERILEDAAQRAAATLPAGSRVLVHKNNTDGKGAAYGTHENYLVPRSVPFGRLTQQLVPFFVSRLVFVGAGRLGTEFVDRVVPYQLSQRADFFEVEVGLETTLKRPLMNTRDEPHADPTRYRRLHVINGDANLCDVATFLKVGTMLLLLDVIEDEQLPEMPALRDSVRAFHTVSHDPTLTATVADERGATSTAVEWQWRYFDACQRYVKDHAVDDAVTQRVLDTWEAVLTTAERDPRGLQGQVDWATKLDLLDGYAQRHDLDWQHDRLKMVDLQYHDVRRDKGLFHRLAARGRVTSLVDEGAVSDAVTTPPEDTRAWFRGECIRRFGADVVAAGWDAIIVDAGDTMLKRIPMMEPGRGTRESIGALLDSVSSMRELVEQLTAS